MNSRHVLAIALALPLAIACGGDDGDEGGQADAAPGSDGQSTPDAGSGPDAGPAFTDYTLPWLCDANTEAKYSFDSDPNPLNAECTMDTGWNLDSTGIPASQGPIPAFLQSAELDGMFDYMNAGQLNRLTLSDQLTIDVWINVAATPTDDQVVIFSGDPNGPERQFELAVAAGGAITWKTYDSSCIGVTTVSSTALAAGQWVHVRALYNSGVSALYLNGFEIAGATQSDFCNSLPVAQFAIGARPVQFIFGNYFAGEIDELRISSIAR